MDVDTLDAALRACSPAGIILALFQLIRSVGWAWAEVIKAKRQACLPAPGKRPSRS